MTETPKQQKLFTEILNINQTPPPAQNPSNSYSNKIKGFVNNKLDHRIKLVHRMFKYIIIGNLLLLHIYFELDILNSPYAYYYNWLNFITGIFASAILCIKFIENHESNDGERFDIQKDIKFFIIEIIFMLMMPYPFTNEIYITIETKLGIQSEYKLNYCLLLISVIKTTSYSSIILIKNLYTSPRANRVCKMYGAKPGVIFSIRSAFKDDPFSFITIIFIVSIFSFAILFRVSEYKIYEGQASITTMYINMFYMTIITMTSVGYGDFKPQSVLGRLTGTICVTWGVLIVSIMVVVLINAFRMDRNEAQSFNILRRIENTSHIRNIAGQFIRQSLWRLWKNYKLKMKKYEKLSERKLMERFRKERRLRDISLISQYEIDFYKEMVRHFERAFINIQNLTENNLMIVNYLNEKYIFND